MAPTVRGVRNAGSREDVVRPAGDRWSRGELAERLVENVASSGVRDEVGALLGGRAFDSLGSATPIPCTCRGSTATLGGPEWR